MLISQRTRIRLTPEPKPGDLFDKQCQGELAEKMRKQARLDKQIPRLPSAHGGGTTEEHYARIDARRAALLEFVREHQPVTTQTGAEHFGITRNTCQEDMNNLAAQGLVEKHKKPGHGQTGFWTITEGADE